jgi:hypothetical protein
MINKEMNDKSEKVEQKEENPVNDIGGFYFSSAIKIFDPNTEEILVQARGDN